MSEANKIYLMLGGIGALIGVHVWLGNKVADITERKGYPRTFGFLLGFYFSVIGLFIAGRLQPDPVGQKMHEVEALHLKTVPAKVVSSTPWQLVWTGRKPAYAPLFVMLSIALGFTLYLQNRPEDLGGGTISLVNIPYERGDWKFAGETNTDDGLMKEIKADAYTLRYYVNQKTKQQVQLYLVYRRYGRREFNHNPDQCFPAGGYRLLTRGTAKMPWAGGERDVVHMVFDGSRVLLGDKKMGVPEATVCYFFASGTKTEHVFLRQQMWMALERLLPNKNGWALMRLNSPRITTDADALAAQQDFMREFGPAIQQTITTDTTGEVGSSTPVAAR